MAKVNIEKLRERLGTPGKPISQSDLARRLGVNQATVSRWETGDIEPDGPAAILLRQLWDGCERAEVA